MKTIFFILGVFILFSCRQQKETRWKTIEVGDYLFDFPSDFKLTSEQGIDSYVGKIEGDSMWFGFDFGYYSDDFAQTEMEFLNGKSWLHDAGTRFLTPGITYSNNNWPKVDVLAIRRVAKNDDSVALGSDYVASCKHDTTVFDFPIFIPTETKIMNICIDSIGATYRKIVFAKDPMKNPTGIYLRNLKASDSLMNNYLALSMSTGKLTKRQQLLALKIYLTGRPKKVKGED